MEQNLEAQLKFEFINLMTYINQEMKLMNSPDGMDFLSFAFVTDPEYLTRYEKEMALPSEYDGEPVRQYVQELKSLWEQHEVWYAEPCRGLQIEPDAQGYGKLIPEAEWKVMYNDEAEKYGWPVFS